MNSETDIGQIFLTGFVHELIKVSKPSPETAEIKMPFQVPAKIEKERRAIEMLPEFITPIQTIPLKNQSLIGAKPNPFIKQIPQRARFMLSRKLEQAPAQTAQQPNTLLQLDINEKPTAEKLNFLIKDPAVTEIECMGSEQPLLVKKAGAVQRTRVRLSIEEIYELIAEFSQKTRIPVIEGTFKAALSNLILTAILSETLGPRFILQKKNPFQELIPQ